MIRLAVLVLLAVNLLYLGWSRLVGRDDAQLVAVTAAPAKLLPPPVPPPCASLGPFPDELQALQVKQKLDVAGWGVLRRDANETLHEGWWVYVDNADTRQQLRTVDTLRRAGIGEAFAMPDNPDFRVSVGIFSVEDRAEDRAGQVQRLKLDALVKERIRDQSVIWFDVPGVARETLSDGRLAAAGVAVEKLRIEACPATAPAAPDAPAAAIIPGP